MADGSRRWSRATAIGDTSMDSRFGRSSSRDQRSETEDVRSLLRAPVVVLHSGAVAIAAAVWYVPEIVVTATSRSTATTREQLRHDADEAEAILQSRFVAG